LAGENDKIWPQEAMLRRELCSQELTDSAAKIWLEKSSWWRLARKNDIGQGRIKDYTRGSKTLRTERGNPAQKIERAEELVNRETFVRDVISSHRISGSGSDLWIGPIRDAP
jgi:hypothetical protein